jgi:hypothetical protein
MDSDTHATTTELSNPSLQVLAYVSNSAATSGVTLGCGSFVCLLSGMLSFAGNPKWGMDSEKTGVTTEISLITIQNCLSYNGVINRDMLRFNSISMGAYGGFGYN